MKQKYTRILFLSCWISFTSIYGHAQSLTLTQLQLEATDPEAAADWYIKHLGFTSKDVRLIAGQITVASATSGDLTILFMRTEKPEPRTLSFHTDNIKKLYESLVASKVSISLSLNSLPGAPETEKNFAIEDPSGNTLYFEGTLK